MKVTKTTQQTRTLTSNNTFKKFERVSTDCKSTKERCEVS